jgi:hypothetical protein
MFIFTSLIKKNNFMKIYLKILIASVLFIFASCGSVTDITGYWNEDNLMNKTYKKIAVLAITNSIENRNIVESSFTEKLITNGYGAVKGSDLLSPEVIKRKDKTEIAEILKKNNVDGVLVLSLLDIKESEHYVPGTETYYPRPYYGGYYDYYYYNYDRVYTPGYYAKSTQVYLESNFYNIADGKLVSTMQTETVDPMNVSDLADSFSKTIVKFMIENKMIIKQVN